jgi:hypothetical protein
LSSNSRLLKLFSNKELQYILVDIFLRRKKFAMGIWSPITRYKLCDLIKQLLQEKRVVNTQFLFIFLFNSSLFSL